MKIRVADYLTNKLYEAGGETVFLITGGMIMHLTDALKMHGRQCYVCCHHEQAAVMAAEAYGRYFPLLTTAVLSPSSLNRASDCRIPGISSIPCSTRAMHI